MNSKTFLLLILFIAFSNNLNATFEYPKKAYRYRVYLSDKDSNPYSVKRPELFLSQKSIERRKKLKIKVDKRDLPITPIYLKAIREQGFRVVNMSKWNNTVVVETNDTVESVKLLNLSFVDKIKKVWEGPDSTFVFKVHDRSKMLENKYDTLNHYYGYGKENSEQLNLIKLHDKGFRGKGMTIAVIDGGFLNADIMNALKDVNVIGTRNFVEPDKSVYEVLQDHGTMVLSCMATNLPNTYIGTSPEASYYLLQSEDTRSEQIIEEDNWCAAVEYADSLGVDIITSSLGYYHFDDASTNHQYYEQDGLTALNSQSASLAASRGILLLNSAGNEGNECWKKIGFPGDAFDMLTVGAVDSKGVNAEFSSVGNTVDGRIKPDIMARGENVSLFDNLGNISKADGTSFSCPILCGAATCLWQAFPNVKPEKIIDAIRRSANRAKHPDNIYGYGIPDFMKAYEILQEENK